MVFSNPWNHSNQLYYTQYEGTCIYLAKSTDNQVSHPVATVWRAMTPAWKKIAFPLRDLCLEETRRRDSVSAWARGRMAPLMQGPIFFSDQLHKSLPSPERSLFMQNSRTRMRSSEQTPSDALNNHIGDVNTQPPMVVRWTCTLQEFWLMDRELMIRKRTTVFSV